MGYIIPLHGGEDISQHADGKKNNAAFKYEIVGYDSDILALAAIDAYKAATYSVAGVPLVFDAIDLTHVEADIYHAVVSYIHPDRQEQDDTEEDTPEWNFDISGQNITQTHGFAVRDAYPAGADKNIFGGAINVEKDTKGRIKVKGTENEITTLAFSLDIKIPQPLDPPALARQLAQAASRTNKTVWYGFQAGEVKFRGARVRGKLRQRWSMSYLFAASQNVVINLPVVGACFKRGWDYFWVYYQPVERETPQGTMLVPAPVYAFTHRMCEEFEFRDLGIGG